MNSSDIMESMMKDVEKNNKDIKILETHQKSYEFSVHSLIHLKDSHSEGTKPININFGLYSASFHPSHPSYEKLVEFLLEIQVGLVKKKREDMELAKQRYADANNG